MPSVSSNRGSAPRQDFVTAFPRVPKLAVNNIIGLDKYYRSATLLLRQADEYRNAKNDYQLYTMLMRFASLVLETIPQHANFGKGGRREYEQERFKEMLVTRYMPELEQTKMGIALREKEGQHGHRHAPHASDTAQLVTSNLPELSNWGLNGSNTPALSQHAAADLDRLALSVQEQHLPTSNGATAAELPSWATPSTTLRLPPASEAARNRHALLPSAAPARRVSASAGPAPALYPEFDRTPAPPIDWGPPRTASGSLASTPSTPAPSAPPLPTPQQQSLLDAEPPGLLQQQQQQHYAHPDELLSQLQPPRPQVELQLGPQEVQVQSMPTPDRAPAPGEVCSHEPGVEVVPPLGTDQPGPVVAKERVGIREVHVSMALMDEFLKYAASNTRRGVESCGILAGALDEAEGAFRISTLIIPKQEGTSDTVQALNEEEIFDVQDKRSLYPLGWIHTHPTQTCFLSSVDVHTQCGYQTMLEEAVAIVMAPRDSAKRCGLFRLSTPGGLQLVQKCPQRGFHTHPPTATGQSVYELCGHVYLNPRVQHDVVDLR